MRICLAIPTYRRSAYLPELFAALAALAVPADCTLAVVVADNDPSGEARDVVARASAAVPFELRYVHVPLPGLSSVRNALLAHAVANADALAMLDDDERPEPQWLAELVHVAQTTGADAVVGPVQAILPDDAPRWIRDFRAGEYPVFANAARLTDGWSSNCLVRVDRIIERGLTFDPALNFSGGEDQLFFRQLVAGGGTIVYAAHATVWELLPPARRSLAFILRRSFRRGNSLAMCDRRLNRGTRSIATRAAKGGALIALSLLRVLPLTICRGMSAVVATACEIARGAGMLTGLFGLASQPYRRGA